MLIDIHIDFMKYVHVHIIVNAILQLRFWETAGIPLEEHKIVLTIYYC